jgi:hypothetical protein
MEKMKNHGDYNVSVTVQFNSTMDDECQTLVYGPSSVFRSTA